MLPVIFCPQRLFPGLVLCWSQAGQNTVGHRVTGTAQHMVVCGSSWGLYVIPHHPGSPHDTGIALGMDERLFRSTGSSRSQLGETFPTAVLLQLGWDSGSLLVLRPLWMGRDHKPCPVTLQIWALYYLME